ncbi:MAG: hypothetical protein EKK33_06845 [Bradyrhizobiaceae bacterium]|nr:MAG: hypothetical protein EKK33_06845 [Bradyrhizobiaceae bacterium]
MRYASLYQFTDAGNSLFERAFNGTLDEMAVDLDDPAIAQMIPGTGPFQVIPFETAKEMALAIKASLGNHQLPTLVPNTGLWAWLTFVLRDVLFLRDKAGRREFGEVHRWYPSNPNDWQKAQRHLVRMPVLLVDTLGDTADHLLCGSPAVLPEIREQLTSQQDMFHPVFQAAARALYYDPEKQKLKKGAGGKKGGTPRRLAKVRSQLDVTWDMYDLTPEKLVGLLPKEFDRFRQLA